MAQRRLEEAILVSRAEPREFLGTERLLERHSNYQFDEEKDGIFSLQFSSDGTVVALGYGDGTIQTINTQNVALHKELRVGRPVALAVTMLRFNPQNSNDLWASSAEGKVYRGDIQNGSCEAVIDEPGNEINCLSFSREGDVLATAGRDHAVRLYDTTTLKLKKMYKGHLQSSQRLDKFDGHSSKIFIVKYHPNDNNVFLTGGWDNVVGIWDSRTEIGFQRHISGPHIAGDGLDIKNNQVVTASWVHSDALQLWDYAQCRLIHNLAFRHDNNGAYLYSCRFFGKNRVIAGGSGTKSIQLTKVKSKKVVAETNFKNAVFSIDVDRSDEMVAIGGAGRKMLLMKA